MFATSEFLAGNDFQEYFRRQGLTRGQMFLLVGGMGFQAAFERH
jgi:hypothetical protein